MILEMQLWQTIQSMIPCQCLMDQQMCLAQAIKMNWVTFLVQISIWSPWLVRQDCPIWIVKMWKKSSKVFLQMSHKNLRNLFSHWLQLELLQVLQSILLCHITLVWSPHLAVLPIQLCSQVLPDLKCRALFLQLVSPTYRQSAFPHHHLTILSTAIAHSLNHRVLGCLKQM